MEELHREARAGLAKAVATHLSLERFEGLRGVALASRQPDQLREATRQLLTGPRRRQAQLLRQVDSCLTLAEGERVSLQQDFGFTGTSLLVPNGASEHEGDPPGGLPREFLLCVGRLEARKNQLALANVAERLDLPLVLVGPFNRRHKRISEEIQRRVRESSRISWFPQLPRHRVLALQRAATCHVLPSWCEVVPQVDLEAARAGTRVVTTTRGHTDEYLGDQATYWDPASRERGLACAVERTLEQAPPQLTDPDALSWERVGQRLLDSYRAISVTAAEEPPSRSTAEV